MRTILRRGEDSTRVARDLDAAIVHTTNPKLRNHLLVAGGIMDQPARWLDLVTLVGTTEAATEAKDMELREKKMKQDSAPMDSLE